MSEIILAGSFAFLMVGFGCVALAFAYDIFKESRK